MEYKISLRDGGSAAVEGKPIKVKGREKTLAIRRCERDDGKPGMWCLDHIPTGYCLGKFATSTYARALGKDILSFASPELDSDSPLELYKVAFSERQAAHIFRGIAVGMFARRKYEPLRV